MVMELVQRLSSLRFDVKAQCLAPLCLCSCQEHLSISKGSWSTCWNKEVWLPLKCLWHLFAQYELDKYVAFCHKTTQKHNPYNNQLLIAYHILYIVYKQIQWHTHTHTNINTFKHLQWETHLMRNLTYIRNILKKINLQNVRFRHGYVPFFPIEKNLKTTIIMTRTAHSST